MKTFHTLKTSWLLVAMAVAIIIGEALAWQISHSLNFRFAPIAVGAICVGLVALTVSFIYDGHE